MIPPDPACGLCDGTGTLLPRFVTRFRCADGQRCLCTVDNLELVIGLAKLAEELELRATASREEGR